MKSEDGWAQVNSYSVAPQKRSCASFWSQNAASLVSCFLREFTRHVGYAVVSPQIRHQNMFMCGDLWPSVELTLSSWRMKTPSRERHHHYIDTLRGHISLEIKRIDFLTGLCNEQKMPEAAP